MIFKTILCYLGELYKVPVALRLGDPLAVNVAYANEVLSNIVSTKILLLKPLYHFMVVIPPYPITRIFSHLGRYP